MASLQDLLVGVFLAAWLLFFIFIIRWNKLRREKLESARSAEEPWFPENEAKVAYCALVEQHPEAELDPGVKKQMTAALLKRAMVDIEYAQRITEERNSLQQLIKDGAIGEGIWQKLQRAEAELNEEILEVISEAESYKDGWGKTIMEEASQLLRHERQRAMQASQQAQAQAQAHAQHQQQQVQSRDKGKSSSSNMDMAERQRQADKMMQELLAEEEKEKRKSAGGSLTKKKK